MRGSSKCCGSGSEGLNKSPDIRLSIHVEKRARIQEYYCSVYDDLLMFG